VTRGEVEDMFQCKVPYQFDPGLALGTEIPQNTRSIPSATKLAREISSGPFRILVLEDGKKTAWIDRIIVQTIASAVVANKAAHDESIDQVHSAVCVSEEISATVF
jgi:hypothetical protein